MSGRHGSAAIVGGSELRLLSHFLLSGDNVSESRILELFGRPHC